MKRLFTAVVVVCLLLTVSSPTKAQTVDREVYFDVSDQGISKNIQFGIDTAWPSEQNFRRAANFMGIDQIDLARVSFQPNYPLVNGDIQQPQIDELNNRMSFVQQYGNPNTDIVMNVAADQVDTSSYYHNSGNWSDLVKATATRIQNMGYDVVSVGPMNEPDYSTHQGSIDDFYNIVVAMNADPFFNNIYISGGNVLNCDEANPWYNYLLPAGLNEGNTHQLAGSFDSYASFFQNVASNGHRVSNDEVHNVGEALVGYEYGMETGIWWGPAELARGEMVKAMDGQRLAYSEHRANWTAAAVYRTPAGKVQAFLGGSERQAATTTYKFISQNKAVFFDGHGPYYEYTMEYPGGVGYWNGQTNAERVINITWGEDIQPVIDGSYILVNRNSGLALEVANAGTSDGSNVQQGSYSGGTNQQWNVYPVDSRIGGDFSYFHINPVSSTDKSLDLYNYSLEDGANIDIWTSGNSTNHQWYLEYAEDGWFYIRNRESSKCLDVANNGAASGDNIQQESQTGGYSQQWRLIPVGSPVEFNVPNAPSNLVGTANSTNISLSWTASSSSDVSGYTIYRAAAGEAFNTIARNVSTTSYTDNDAQPGVDYYYKIKAVDASLNGSSQTAQIGPLVYGSCDPSTMVAYYQVNGGAWTIGTNITVNSGDQITFGPQPITGGTWSWTGCGTSGSAREQTVTLTSSCTATAAYTNDCGAQSSVTYDVTVLGSLAGFKQLQNRATGHFLDGLGLTTDGVDVAQWANTSSYNSQWDLIHVENDFYQLQNRATGLFLDGMGRTNNGDACAQWANTVSTNSQWELIQIEGEFYQLKNRATGLFLDNLGQTANGATVVQWANTVSYNSQWQLIDMSSARTAQGVAASLENQLSLELYPNPVSDVLTIQSQENESGQLRLFDMLGHLVMSQEMKGGKEYLNLASLKSGIYMVQVTQGSKTITKRLVKE